MTIPLAGWVGRRHGKGWCELICAPFLETPTHLLTPYSCSNSTLLETILAVVYCIVHSFVPSFYIVYIGTCSTGVYRSSHPLTLMCKILFLSINALLSYGLHA